MVTLKWWLENVNGAKIDADGAYGFQCWDLWADYAYRVVGVPRGKNGAADATYTSWAGAGPHPGKSDYACNVFHNFNQNAVLKRYFTAVPKSAKAREGDVAFWDISAAYPGSHVAIVTDDYGDNGLRCMSQNNNPRLHGLTPSAYITLTKSGLLGYLRPKAGGAPAGSAEELTMADIDNIMKELRDLKIITRETRAEARENKKSLDNKISILASIGRWLKSRLGGSVKGKSITALLGDLADTDATADEFADAVIEQIGEKQAELVVAAMGKKLSE